MFGAFFLGVLRWEVGFIITAAPTMPSGLSLRKRWKFITAAWVNGPKIPSADVK